LDFGASHKLPHEPILDDASMLRVPVATPGYASCQVLEGETPDPRDDLFAFACVTYVLLAGKHPFSNKTALQARAQHMTPQRPAGLSHRQWRALLAGLHWERGQRPSDMQQWLERLDLRSAARRLSALSMLVKAPPPRKSGLMLAVGAAAALLVAAGAAYWMSTHDDAFGQNVSRWLVDAKSAATDATAALQAKFVGTQQPKSEQPAPAEPEPAPAPAASITDSVAPAPAPVAAQESRRIAPPTPPASNPPLPAIAVAPTPPPIRAAAAPPALAAQTPAAATSPAGATSNWPARLETAVDSIDVPAGESTAQIVVKRRGNFHGETSFTWWTESGTAKPGTDFAPIAPREQTIGDRRTSTNLSVPLVSNSARKQARSFYVVIDQPAAGAVLGARHLTMVTILPAE
jgi:hypothetical protein